MKLFYMIFCIFSLCFKSFSHKVSIRYLIHPQVARHINLQNWSGTIYKHHVSTLEFEDGDNIIADHLGEFLVQLDKSMTEGTIKNPRSFTGKAIQSFPSQHTGAVYHVLQGSEPSKDELEKARNQIEQNVLSYYRTKKGLLPTALEAEFQIRKSDIRGFPHASLTKSTPPLKKLKIFWRSLL